MNRSYLDYSFVSRFLWDLINVCFDFAKGLSVSHVQIWSNLFCDANWAPAYCVWKLRDEKVDWGFVGCSPKVERVTLWQKEMEIKWKLMILLLWRIKLPWFLIFLPLFSHSLFLSLFPGCWLWKKEQTVAGKPHVCITSSFSAPSCLSQSCRSYQKTAGPFQSLSVVRHFWKDATFVLISTSLGLMLTQGTGFDCNFIVIASWFIFHFALEKEKLWRFEFILNKRGVYNPSSLCVVGWSSRDMGCVRALGHHYVAGQVHLLSGNLCVIIYCWGFQALVNDLIISDHST